MACHPIEYQTKIAKKLKKLDIGVIVCPSAAISMTQDNKQVSPIHNSIAPVSVLLENGVDVGLGIDNMLSFDLNLGIKTYQKMSFLFSFINAKNFSRKEKYESCSIPSLEQVNE